MNRAERNNWTVDKKDNSKYEERSKDHTEIQ